MAKKSTTLRILSVKRTRQRIFVSYHNGDDVLTVNSRDNPLPAFTKSLDALTPLVCSICHFPDDYAEGIKAKGLSIAQAKGDLELVTLMAEKHLPDSNGPLNIATPLRLLDKPEKAGSSVPLSDHDIGLVEEVVEQAKAYVLGNRAQGKLSLEDDGEKPDDKNSEDGDVLDFSEQPTGSGQTAPESEKSKPRKQRGAVRPPKKK